jgi:hypothetical protein
MPIGRSFDHMIVVRLTNHAKYGHGDALLALTKEMLDTLRQDTRVSNVRILTDVSGDMFMVEHEFQVKSLAVFEEVHAELTRGTAFATWFSKVQQLVDHGTRQFFRVRG